MPADKLHIRRFEIDRILKSIPVRTGDIFFRMGNDSYFGFPFDQAVGRATKSLFSHASVALVEDGEIWLVEVDMNGTSQQRFLDWVDDCATNDVQVWRPDVTKLGMDLVGRLETSIKNFLSEDGDYDMHFSGDGKRFYCTESVEVIFKNAGCPELCKAETPMEVLPAWAYYVLFIPGNWIGSLVGASMPTGRGLWFVGNDEHGLMSSQYLYEIFRHSGK